MTLIARNKILSVLCVFSVLLLITLLAFFLIHVFKGISFPYPLDYTTLTIKSFILNSFTIFSVISLFFLCLFACVTSFIIRYSFEKTQSPEIIFFLGFLISCLLEGFRLLIPILDLWNNYSKLIILIGKAAYTGRLIFISSFLLTAFVSRENQNQDTERNLLIIILIALLFAEFLPINTGKTLPSIMPSIRFSSMFFIIFFVIGFITCVTLFLLNKKEIILGYIFMVFGYFFLITCENFIQCVLGIFFLSVGTFNYLKKMHNYYLWQ